MGADNMANNQDNQDNRDHMEDRPTENQPGNPHEGTGGIGADGAYDIDEPAPGDETLAFESGKDGKGLSELDALRRDHEELQQRLLRVSADYQNFVRRSNMNIQSAREEATSKIVKALVPVLDNIDAAMAVDADKATLENLMAGVQIVGDEFSKTLASFGVTKLTAEAGDEFDPNQHEALMRQPAEDIETNHVVAMLQAGYALGDKTLRPVKVTVAE